MAFDPDKYLAKKGAKPEEDTTSKAFDPDAYLASKGPEWLQKGTKNGSQPGDKGEGPNDLERTLAEARALTEKKTDELGFLSRAGNSIAQGAKAVATVGSDLATSPLETLRNPSKRRELTRGIDDVVTLGYGQRLASRIGRALGDKPDVDLEATAAGDAEAAPSYRAAGNIAGSFIPGGAANTIAKGGGRLASKALNVQATGKAANAVLGTAKGLAGYEASAPLTAALSADAEGDRLGAAERAAKDPAGMLASSIGGALGGTAKGYRDTARDPSTLAGRTVRNIEKEGGKIQMLGKNPVRGGLYEAAELADLPEGRAGVNQLADRAQGRITDHNKGKLASAREEFGARQEAILAKHRGLDYDFAPMHARLDEILGETTTSNGVVGDTGLANAIAHIKKMTSVPDDLGRFETAAGTVDDLLKAQRVVKQNAQYGAPVTEQSRPYRLLDRILSDEGAQIDPALRSLKAKYAETMGSLEDANDILYGRRKPEVNASASQERSAASRLGRVGDETQAATGAAERQIDELGKLDPAYERELRLVKAKKDIERLRYGEPETSTGIEKGMSRSAGGAVRSAALGALGLKLGGLPGAAVGAVAGKFAQNPLATQLRIGLPIADAVGDAGEIGARSGTMLEAIRRGIEAKKRRDQEMRR